MNENLPATDKKNSPWQKIIRALGYNQRFFWTTFWFILGFIMLIIPIFCAQMIHRIIFAPAFLWSFAYLMLGVLFGFIFGVPTIITSGQPGVPSGTLNAT